MYGIGGDRQIVVDEVGAKNVVREDPAHFCSRHEHDLRSLLRHPTVCLRLIAQIEFAAISGQDFAVFTGEAPDKRTADHPAMTGNEDALPNEGKRNFRRYCRVFRLSKINLYPSSFI